MDRFNEFRRPSGPGQEASMEQWKAVLRWIELRRDLLLDLVRVYLGIGLFVKGLQFLSNREFLASALRDSSQLDFMDAFLAHYIPLAHLGGGLLLAIGLLTRVSALLQLPILIGAVFLVLGRDGLFAHGQEFQFTCLVLFLLGIIAVGGAGRLSVDHLLRTR
jgi:uncharacterized membrane protein YphA (DoxX/SURF4 family)